MSSNDPLHGFLRQISWAGLALLLVMVIGTVGYWIIGEGKSSLLDSLFMTVITVASIGYGEITENATTPIGRAFTIFIALFGIGVLTYVLTAFTAFFVEGNLRHSFKRIRMEKMIAQLHDHFIVCGLEGAGRYIVNELQATKRPYVVLIRKRETLLSFYDGQDLPLHMVGDIGSNELLQRAGVERAFGLFAADLDDNINLMVALTARQLNKNMRIVSHCRDLQNIAKMRLVGADAVISMEQIGGMRMASEMVRPTVVSFLDTMLRDTQKNLRIEEVSIPLSRNGKPISSLGLNGLRDVLLLAVRTTDGWHYHPEETFVLEKGFSLILMTTPTGRQEVERLLVS